MQPTFHIRPATLAAGDVNRMLAYFDSQLAWLATVGSGKQWGSTPRGDDAQTQQKYTAKIARSEASVDQPFAPDWVRAYIVEAQVDVESLGPEARGLATGVDDDGTAWVPVAAMVLEAKSADYLRSVIPEQDERDPFVFLSYLLSDRRARDISKGAGAVLLDHMKDEVRKLGVRRICADCWRGNDRKLVKYYERHGFRSIGSIGVEGSEKREDWPGAVLEMRL